MKNLQLMLHLQRLLDGELPDTGLDDLEDLGTDDLEGGEASDLEDLGPIMEELDEMNAERDDPLDGLDMDLDGMESLLETDDAGAVVPGTGGPDDDLKRLEELINPGAGKSAVRPRPAVSARRPGAARSAAPRGEGAAARGRDGRLKRLLRVLDDVDEDDPVEEDVRRLRRLVGSRMASGGAAARRDPFDPVILRRREQIREFLGAWRETLRAARRREREEKS
jgi:hypothetical protein